MEEFEKMLLCWWLACLQAMLQAEDGKVYPPVVLVASMSTR